MSVRRVLLVIVALLIIARPAAAQPRLRHELTVRIFTTPSVDIPGLGPVERDSPIIGDVLAMDADAIVVKVRDVGRIARVPIAAIDRLEHLTYHDPVADSMRLLAATGGSWLGGMFAGRGLFGAAATGAKLGAVALAGAAAWAAYSVVLHANERERWEPTDLERVRRALAAAARSRFR